MANMTDTTRISIKVRPFLRAELRDNCDKILIAALPLVVSR